MQRHKPKHPFTYEILPNGEIWIGYYELDYWTPVWLAPNKEEAIEVTNFWNGEEETPIKENRDLSEYYAKFDAWLREYEEVLSKPRVTRDVRLDCYDVLQRKPGRGL